ncbi:hypothetical protein, partial [Jiangella muralis]|uniref:hypothetical protein n=1 Tax=Jiangella muralis TaxID=702383 RepID=UPI001969BC5C
MASDADEVWLRDAMVHGFSLALSEKVPNWPAEDDPDVAIPAAAVRAVLLDRDLAAHIDPRGLVVIGAVIVGDLDLADVHIGYPISFRCCRFTDGLDLVGATVHSLVSVGKGGYLGWWGCQGRRP